MNDGEVQLCFIGDSFVAGVGDETGLGWTGRLVVHAASAGRPVTAYNLGIRGNTSADILARAGSEVDARRNPMRRTAVVLSMGVNDTIFVDGAPRVALAESCANLGLLLDMFADDPVLVVGPPAVSHEDVNDRIRELTLRFHSLCRDRDVPFVPVFEPLEDNPVWRRQVLEGDGAHPRSEGYMELYELVAPYWERWLEQ
ncbi:lysophospholipase L1-like esterase [Arthrobacter stackebrandtii]|uniref:Lysophospholipase L1-like esterase n=1 Tax=Arthrobacter stackebrandtii TaxID=272161 RepID=A0ABS4YXA5_9MICC|nr:GDSL-type esterase/lipase family protein [Arthrobacter stackebrandtii]MBP2413082.1 lysophospholipase L1-like esterase [Arthrobacter stackebrandtii]PYH01148.1 G-D-S-L family lipolytic protein [Arthrobacter stackebrandtii]